MRYQCLRCQELIALFLFCTSFGAAWLFLRFPHRISVRHWVYYRYVFCIAKTDSVSLSTNSHKFAEIDIEYIQANIQQINIFWIK